MQGWGGSCSSGVGGLCRGKGGTYRGGVGYVGAGVSGSCRVE